MLPSSIGGCGLGVVGRVVGRPGVPVDRGGVGLTQEPSLVGTPVGRTMVGPTVGRSVEPGVGLGCPGVGDTCGVGVPEGWPGVGLMCFVGDASTITGSLDDSTYRSSSSVTYRMESSDLFPSGWWNSNQVIGEMTSRTAVMASKGRRRPEGC
jgi:hypothetical protein